MPSFKIVLFNKAHLLEPYSHGFSSVCLSVGLPNIPIKAYSSYSFNRFLLNFCTHVIWVSTHSNEFVIFEFGVKKIKTNLENIQHFIQSLLLLQFWSEYFEICIYDL